jgi:hypothetical protein
MPVIPREIVSVQAAVVAKQQYPRERLREIESRISRLPIQRFNVPLHFYNNNPFASHSVGFIFNNALSIRA